MNTDVHTPIQQAYARHLARQHGLDLCRILLELIQNLQQHRGATLAVLGGDHFFEIRIQLLQPHISSALEKLAQDQSGYIEPLEYSNLTREWLTIRDQWLQDSASHNFELHTHLIQETLKLIWLVAIRSGHTDRQLQDQETARFVLIDLPRLMEQVAQLRGRATHAAVCGGLDRDIGLRLEYLCRQISEQFGLLSGFWQRQECPGPRLERQHESLSQSHERWDILQQRIVREILNPHRIEISPDVVFSECSFIISSLFRMMLAGISRLRSNLDQEMQGWIRTSTHC